MKSSARNSQANLQFALKLQELFKLRASTLQTVEPELAPELVDKHVEEGLQPGDIRVDGDGTSENAAVEEHETPTSLPEDAGGVPGHECLIRSRARPSNRRSRSKSPGHQGGGTNVRRRALVRRSKTMQFPRQPDHGESLIMLPSTLLEQIVEEDTKELHSDGVVSGQELEGRAQDVPKSPAVQVRKKRSQVAAAVPRTAERNDMTCRQGIMKKAPPKKRAQSWSGTGSMRLVSETSDDGAEDTCNADTVERRCVSGPTVTGDGAPSLASAEDAFSVDTVWRRCVSEPASTGNDAPPLASGWWCDDAACGGQDVFVSLQDTPDTTDLGYMSVTLPQLRNRAEDCSSPALSEDSADFVVNIGRGPGTGRLDASCWTDSQNHDFTPKSCQSQQQQQQQATLAVRQSNTASPRRSARVDLFLRPAHLVDSPSCGLGSEPKDARLLPPPARRPLPTEVTLGGDDIHSSPTTFEMAEVIGPPAFATGTVAARGCEALCQQQKPQHPQKIIAESFQMAATVPTTNSDIAKSTLQEQKLARRPRSSSSRGRCCTNKGGSDARFLRLSMQQIISNDSPACTRKELVPVRQSLVFPHQATTSGVGDLGMTLQPILVSGGSKITSKQKHGRSTSKGTGLAVQGTSCGHGYRVPPELIECEQ